jgi:uridine kinase
VVDPVAGLVRAITHAKARCGDVRVVAIDGGAASGKSSLAAQLADRLDEAAVLHTDDLLDGWTDQFTFWSRLRAEVFAPLAAGQAARYRRYDWIARQFRDWVEVPIVKTLVVEGVSSIEACADYLALAIMLEVDRAERERRWIDRDGALQPEWTAWLDNEERYFAAHPPSPDVLVLRSGSWLR